MGSIGGRGDRVSKDPEAWHNQRDKTDVESQGDKERLTHEERYGVRSNTPLPGGEE